MTSRMVRRFSLVVACIGLVLALLAVPAFAKTAATTKMAFKLHGQHSLTMGESLDCTVTLQSRDAHQWVGIPGASVNVTVDGTWVATAFADGAGVATFTWTANSVGDHVMKLIYAGDDTHKKAQRAQGFNVAPVTD